MALHRPHPACQLCAPTDRAPPLAQRLFRAVLTTSSGSNSRTPLRPGPGGAPSAAAASTDDVSQDALCRFGWYLLCFAKLRLMDTDADLYHLVDILVVRAHAEPETTAL